MCIVDNVIDCYYYCLISHAEQVNKKKPQLLLRKPFFKDLQSEKTNIKEAIEIEK